MNTKLIQKIIQREEEGTMRSLFSYEGTIDFYSNDYLGIGQEKSNLEIQGTTGSRLISGNRKEMEEIEANLASFFGAPSGLFYQSGFAANLGFFSCVPQKGDVVLYDEECHASIRDGLRLSLASTYKFAHNDMADLEQKLEKFQAADYVYIVVEGLYSMSGKLAPVHPLVELSKKYRAELVVDEAHSAGVYGEEGKGLFHGVDCTRLITFGKAYGAHGALWLGSTQLKQYLINFSRSFIYTTATPFVIMEHAWRNVRHANLSIAQEKLNDNIQLFGKLIPTNYLISDPDSPIQMLSFSGRESLRRVEKSFLDKGIAVKAIYEPTVAKEKEGLRISLHSFNSVEEIQIVAQTIALYL